MKDSLTIEVWPFLCHFPAYVSNDSIYRRGRGGGSTARQGYFLIVGPRHVEFLEYPPLPSKFSCRVAQQYQFHAFCYSNKYYERLFVFYSMSSF
jgi:hypothetical protein